MARTCLIAKTKKPQKYRTRMVYRCGLCGRARAVYRKFRLCRICFRNLAVRGEIPGVRKSSW